MNIFVLSLGCAIPFFLFPLLIFRKLIRNKINRAIKNSDCNELKILLDNNKGLVKVNDIYSSPPIFMAVKKQDLSVVNLLIEYGSETKIKDFKGFSLIMYAKNTQNSNVIDAIERNEI